MRELWFKDISIDQLNPFIVNFSLEPYIGYNRVPFREPIRVYFRTNMCRLNIRRSPGDVIALYVIAYPDFVKIGSSKLECVASRMFTQAPLVGAISSLVVVMDDDVGFEKVERELAEHIRREQRSSLSVTSGRREEYVETYVYRLISTNATNELNVEGLVDVVREVGETCWSTLGGLNYGLEITSLPNILVFTNGLEPEDLEVLRTSLKESRRIVYGILGKRVVPRRGRGELVVLRNGLCVIKTEKQVFVDFCDKFCFNILFETVD